MADVQINTVLVCDDVRREVTGKDILIGVYAGDLNVASLPANILLSIWVEMTAKKKEPQEISLRIQVPNPDHKFEIKANFEAPSPKTSFAIFTPKVPYPIDRAGPLKVYAKLPGSDRFELIKTQQIKYIPPTDSRSQTNPSSTASPPPS